MPNVLEWFNQIAALLPSNWAGIAAKPSDAVILELQQQTVRLIVRVNGERSRGQELSADAAGIQKLRGVLAADPNLPQTMVLRLAPSQVLHKLVTLPAAARRDLEQVLGFEIDRETPFTRDEVHWSYTVQRSDAANGRIDVDLMIVPRAFTDPFIVELGKAGLQPAGIEVNSGSSTTLIPLGAKKRGVTLRIDKPLIPYAAAAAGLAALAFVTPFLVQQWVLFSADAVMSSLTGEAREAATLRQTVDQATLAANFFAKQRQHDQSVVAVLSAITDAMPDDTYLSALSIHDGKVTISGFSSAAADLIGVLTDAPEFKSPAFEAPVVQNADTNLESFTISASLAPAGAS